MKDFVIFDVDGTLIDSVDSHARAWVKAFAEFDKKVGFERVRAEIGKGGDKLLPEFLSAKEIASFGETLSHRRADIFKKEYMPRIKPFPGVRELFERLRAEGHRLALASSAPADELAHYVRQLGIKEHLSALVSADDAAESKPAPDIFLAALERMGAPNPAAAVVVGDSPHDVAAASNAGIQTVGFLSGGFPNRALLGAGCVAVYEGPLDLLRHYETSPLAKRSSRHFFPEAATAASAASASAPDSHPL